ncbi:MAG: ribosome biogenesis protein [Candidatus Lokiarchaeota archaeon]|nr:ribosome biogenesis protein [Candidatus Lokiarchaeota archaeon]MBD3201147.1 ribosome biogenesis protein [Candidatus Lokiarchaeota archaeon]
MTKYLKKCEDCGKYGLKNKNSMCIHCGGTLINPKPPKFSPVDKYQKYRISYFKKEFDEKFERK